MTDRSEFLLSANRYSRSFEVKEAGIGTWLGQKALPAVGRFLETKVAPKIFSSPSVTQMATHARAPVQAAEGAVSAASRMGARPAVPSAIAPKPLPRAPAVHTPTPPAGATGVNPYSAPRAPSGRVGTPAPAAPAAPPQENTFGHLAWNAIRGATGFGPQEGATRTATGVAHAAGVAAIGAPLAMGMMGRSNDPQNPYQQQMMVTAALREQDPVLYIVKSAGLMPDQIRAGVDLASYGALGVPTALRAFAPQLYEKHHTAMHALDAAGLAGLTGTSIYGLARDKGNAPDALDTAGLGLMGLALHRRLTEH